MVCWEVGELNGMVWGLKRKVDSGSSRSHISEVQWCSNISKLKSFVFLGQESTDFQLTPTAAPFGSSHRSELPESPSHSSRWTTGVVPTTRSTCSGATGWRLGVDPFSQRSLVLKGMNQILGGFENVGNKKTSWTPVFSTWYCISNCLHNSLTILVSKTDDETPNSWSGQLKHDGSRCNFWQSDRILKSQILWFFLGQIYSNFMNKNVKFTGQLQNCCFDSVWFWAPSSRWVLHELMSRLRELERARKNEEHHL